MGILSYSYNAAKKFLRSKNKAPGEAIKKTKVGTNLAFKRGEQDAFIKFRDNLYKGTGFDKETKNTLKSKQPLSQINKRKSDIVTPKEPKLAKGGRVGLKFGTTKKSNIQKIKETFGIKKKEKPKERMMAKKGSKPKKKFPDLTGDGKVTFADILKGRGVINGKKKKKVI